MSPMLASRRLAGILCVAVLCGTAPGLGQQQRGPQIGGKPGGERSSLNMLDRPYAPLMALIGPNGPGSSALTEAQVRQIATTWSMVNAHAGMQRPGDPAAGVSRFWAGPAFGVDADGKTIGQRIEALNPDFLLSNYRNGSYVSQFCPNEAAELESRCPLGISVWNTNTVLLGPVDDRAETVTIAKFPLDSLARATPPREGRPHFYPFKTSTTDDEFSRTTRAYVSWIRLGDEVLRIDGVSAGPDGVTLKVRRGIWGTIAVAHAARTAVLQPIYIGRNSGIDQADGSLGGRPDDPSAQPGIRYALITSNSKVHDWLGEKVEALFDDGCEVCWLDVSVSTWYNNANPYGDAIVPWNVGKGIPLNGEDYREWQQLKNDALYRRFPAGRFWINNVKGGNYFANGTDRLQLSGENGHHPVDGGSMEMYANTRGVEPAWVATADMTLDFVRSGFRGVAWAKGAAPGDYRRFAYATYLMAYEPGAKVLFTPGGNGLLNRVPRLYYIDLGKPTVRFTKIAEAESKVAEGVYMRPFTKGLVVVNPGRSEKRLTLETPYIDTATDQIVRQLTLRGNSAVILASPRADSSPER